MKTPLAPLFAFILVIASMGAFASAQEEMIEVAGAVRQGNGKAIPAVEVAVHRDGRLVGKEVRTNENGEFRLEIASGEPIFLEFRHSEWHWSLIRVLSGRDEQKLHVVLLPRRERVGRADAGRIAGDYLDIVTVRLRATESEEAKQEIRVELAARLRDLGTELRLPADGAHLAGAPEMREGELSQHLAAVLILSNAAHTNVSLAALEKLKDETARELAQMVVKDSQQYSSKLRQHAPQAANLRLDTGARREDGPRATVGANREPGSPLVSASPGGRDIKATDALLRLHKRVLEEQVSLVLPTITNAAPEAIDAEYLRWLRQSRMTFLAELRAVEDQEVDAELNQLVLQGQLTTLRHLTEAERLLSANSDLPDSEDEKAPNDREPD